MKSQWMLVFFTVAALSLMVPTFADSRNCGCQNQHRHDDAQMMWPFPRLTHHSPLWAMQNDRPNPHSLLSWHQPFASDLWFNDFWPELAVWPDPFWYHNGNSELQQRCGQSKQQVDRPTEEIGRPEQQGNEQKDLNGDRRTSMENVHSKPVKKSSPQKQKPQAKRSESPQTKQIQKVLELASLGVAEYHPSDLTVSVSGDQLLIHGKQACKCRDACSYREFQRQYKVPRNIDLSSLKASLKQASGVLQVTGRSGETSTQTQMQVTDPVLVPVDVDGEVNEGEEQQRRVNDLCARHKQGLKLRRINAATGEEHVEPEEVASQVGVVSEDEDVTIEVEE